MPKACLEIRRHQLKHWLGKRGKAVCGMALSSAHCPVSCTPFFQHQLSGVWSYMCTFLLPKPESQKFRNAGLNGTSSVIKYDLLLLQALLQIIFSLNVQSALLKAIRFSATIILITIPMIKYLFLLSSLNVFTLCPFAIVPNWPFALKVLFRPYYFSH